MNLIIPQEKAYRMTMALLVDLILCNIDDFAGIARGCNWGQSR